MTCDEVGFMNDLYRRCAINYPLPSSNKTKEKSCKTEKNGKKEKDTAAG